MKVAIFYFSKQGEKQAKVIAENFEKTGCETEKYNNLKIVGDVFLSCGLLVFISAVGIAVRGIAPFVKDKKTDPAVVCLDDSGKFVISLLSGHIGGGNEYAKQISNMVSGTAVITTATDINGKFACDQWARKNSCSISDMQIAKSISATILNQDVAMLTDLTLNGKAGGVEIYNDIKDLKEKNLGIYLSYKTLQPFEKTLALTPKCLIVGVGCKRGTSCARLKETLFGVFERNNLNVQAIERFASIDVKSNEEGLLQLSSELGIPIDFYSAQELSSVQGEFTQSSFVQSVVGVSNVCERASVCEKDAQIILKKTAENGVTIAVSLMNKSYDMPCEEKAVKKMSKDNCEYINMKENQKREITIASIGIGNDCYMSAIAKEAIKNADVVFGGKRMVESLETSGDIILKYKTDEMRDVIESNPNYRKIVVCASGDLAFHSIAKSVRKEFGEEFNISTVAGIGSVSYFLTAIGETYENCVLTSLHAKTCNIATLVSQNEKVFTLLGDASEMLARLCEYNLGDVEVFIGENLSYENEKIYKGRASELCEMNFSALSVALIKNPNASSNTDLPDEIFIRGKIPMTKQEIRRICISKLGLEKTSVAYDIGGGTGSVSCGIASVCSHGKCYSIECVKEGIDLICENAKNLHLDNVIPVFGKAPEAIESLESPTHVFIGGSRGNLKEILLAVLKKNPKVKIVATAIAMETISEITQLAKMLSLYCEICQVQVSNSQKMGEYNLMKGENPVYIFSMCSKENNG